MRLTVYHIFTSLLLWSCLTGTLTHAIVKDVDVCFLMENLCRYSSQWKNIGMSLNFLPGELENIDHNNQKVEQCLKEVLCQWVQWPTASHSQPPAMKTLLDALRSDLVKCGAAANQLERSCLPSASQHD